MKTPLPHLLFIFILLLTSLQGAPTRSPKARSFFKPPQNEEAQKMETEREQSFTPQEHDEIFFIDQSHFPESQYDFTSLPSDGLEDFDEEFDFENDSLFKPSPIPSSIPFYEHETIVDHHSPSTPASKQSFFSSSFTSENSSSSGLNKRKITVNNLQHLPFTDEGTQALAHAKAKTNFSYLHEHFDKAVLARILHPSRNEENAKTDESRQVQDCNLARLASTSSSIPRSSPSLAQHPSTFPTSALVERNDNTFRLEAENNYSSEDEVVSPTAKKAKVFSLDPTILANIVDVTAEAYKSFLKKPQKEQKKTTDRKYLQSIAAHEFTKNGIKSTDAYQYISQIITAAKEKVFPPASPSKEENKYHQTMLEKLAAAQQQGMNQENAIIFVAEQEGREACLKLFSEDPKNRNKIKDRPVIHAAINHALRTFGIRSSEASSHARLKTTEIMNELFPKHIVKNVSSEASRLLQILETRKQDGMEEAEARLAIAKEEAIAICSKMIAQHIKKSGTPNSRESYRNGLVIETSRILRNLGLAPSVAFEQTSSIVTAILHELFPKQTRENNVGVITDFQAAKNRGLDSLAASIEAAKNAVRKAYFKEIPRKDLVSIAYHAIIDCKTMSCLEAQQQAGFLTTEILRELPCRSERECSKEVLADFQVAKNRGLPPQAASLEAAKNKACKAYSEQISRNDLISIAYHAIMDCQTMKGADAKQQAGFIVTKIFHDRK